MNSLELSRLRVGDSVQSVKHGDRGVVLKAVYSESLDVFVFMVAYHGRPIPQLETARAIRYPKGK